MSDLNGERCIHVIKKGDAWICELGKRCGESTSDGCQDFRASKCGPWIPTKTKKERIAELEAENARLRERAKAWRSFVFDIIKSVCFYPGDKCPDNNGCLACSKKMFKEQAAKDEEAGL